MATLTKKRHELRPNESGAADYNDLHVMSPESRPPKGCLSNLVIVPAFLRLFLMRRDVRGLDLAYSRRGAKAASVLSEDAVVPDAVRILANPDTPLIVVCDREGIAVGVMSRADLIELLAREGTKACETNAGAIMTKSMLFCHVDQPLQEVWTSMNARSFRCAPILDNDRRPQGVVHARDIARALLDEASHEEELLRDYVLGTGYQ